MKLIKNLRWEDAPDRQHSFNLIFETEAGNFYFRGSKDYIDLDWGERSLGKELSVERALSRLLTTLSNYEFSHSLKVGHSPEPLLH